MPEERPSSAPPLPLAIKAEQGVPARFVVPYRSLSAPTRPWQAPYAVYAPSPLGRVSSLAHGAVSMATTLRSSSGAYDDYALRSSPSTSYAMPARAGSPSRYAQRQQAPSRQAHRPTLPPIQTIMHARVPAGGRLRATSAAPAPARGHHGVASVDVAPPASSRGLSCASHAPAPPPWLGRGLSADLSVSPPPTDRATPRRPRTPPDCCAVCGVLSTPEWRKGPAGNRSLCNGCGLLAAKRAREREVMRVPAPVTLDEIEAELEEIGTERFKPATGRYKLPHGTRQRIIDTQARTRGAAGGVSMQSRQPQQRPRSRSAKLAGGEKAAIGALVNLRRASVASSTPAHYQSAMAPRSPPASTHGRRAGSVAGEGCYFPSNVGTSGGTGLPPSSSYMLPLVGPASTFSFGRTPAHLAVASPFSARSAASSAHDPCTSAGSVLVSLGSLPSSTTPAPLASPASPAQSVSSLAASTDRMSIAHLTAPSPCPPSPQRWEAPPTSVSRLEHATSALRRRSSSIVGVLPPCLGVARVKSPSPARRTTS